MCAHNVHYMYTSLHVHTRVCPVRHNSYLITFSLRKTMYQTKPETICLELLCICQKIQYEIYHYICPLYSYLAIKGVTTEISSVVHYNSEPIISLNIRKKKINSVHLNQSSFWVKLRIGAQFTLPDPDFHWVLVLENVIPRDAGIMSGRHSFWIIGVRVNPVPLYLTHTV